MSFNGNIRHEEVHPKYAMLSTHCGRRTFIVNALYLSVNYEYGEQIGYRILSAQFLGAFSCQDYLTTDKRLEITEKIAEKHISKFTQSGLINHFAHDKYKKT